jgi:hypothetical protein
MKRALFRSAVAVVATAMFGTVGAFVSPSAGAEEPPLGGLTEGIVDLTVDIQSKFEVVAPAGSGVIYRITASNVGVLPNLTLGATQAVVTGTLPTDFTVTNNGGCAITSTILSQTYSCTVTTLPQTFDIVMKTSLAAVPYSRSATATITSAALTEPLEYTGNNTDTATTSVVELDSDLGHASFVCGGCSLKFDDIDVGNAELFVPAQQHSNPDDANSPLVPVIGVFVKLSQNDDFNGQTCGTGTCNPALEVWFDEAESQYQVLDPRMPIKVKYVPKQLPCKGVGADKCAPLAYFKEGMTAPENMLACDNAGTGTNPGTGQAFVGGVYHLCQDASFKVGSLVGHDVLMRSDDPLIPPISF